MNAINLYYSSFRLKLPEELLQFLLNKLPWELKVINSRYVRWQDRQSHLFGKLLLQHALKEHGYNNEVLKDLKYNKYNRPYLNSRIDFNISHSGEYVICAIGEKLRLGVDIEKFREIDFKDFVKVMTTEQWFDINNSENPIKSFFKYWTIKESLIKADSRGLEIPLLDIHVKENRITYDNHLWYLIPLNIDRNYEAHLAVDKIDVGSRIIKTDFINDISLAEKQILPITQPR